MRIRKGTLCLTSYKSDTYEDFATAADTARKKENREYRRIEHIDLLRKALSRRAASLFRDLDTMPRTNGKVSPVNSRG